MFSNFFQSYMNEFVDFINERPDKFNVTMKVCGIVLTCFGNVQCVMSVSERMTMLGIESMFIDFLKSKRNCKGYKFHIWTLKDSTSTYEIFYIEVEDNDWEALDISEDATMISRITDIMEN